MTGARRTLAALVALATVVILGGLSRVPYTEERAKHAVLRLAWRARGERVEECRHLTPEELRRLPVHMRQEEVCEGRTLPYRLRVTLDDRLAADELVRAAGARHDRPLYVFRELPLEPGRHALAVTFVREGNVPAGERVAEEATPPQLVLDTLLTVAPRQALLVTYDEDSRRLVVKAPLAR